MFTVSWTAVGGGCSWGGGRGVGRCWAGSRDVRCWASRVAVGVVAVVFAGVVRL
jgi:hypothetical protein